VFPRTWLNVLLAFLAATLHRRGRGRAERRSGQHHSRSRPGGALLNTDVIGSLPAVKDWRRR
jgi:hypothetical protein